MRLLLAIAIAVVTYVVWYGVTVGQFCMGMWAGSAPPVIMLLAGTTAYQLLGRLLKKP